RCSPCWKTRGPRKGRAGRGNLPSARVAACPGRSRSFPPPNTSRPSPEDDLPPTPAPAFLGRYRQSSLSRCSTVFVKCRQGMTGGTYLGRPLRRSRGSAFLSHGQSMLQLPFFRELAAAERV